MTGLESPRAETVTIGRPLDADGDPEPVHGLEIDPNGRAAALLRETSHPLVSSPGAGTWATLLEHPDDGAGAGTELLQWLHPDATEPPEHVHPNSERVEVVDGELTVVLDGEPQKLASGEHVELPAGVEHSFRNESDDTVAFRIELSSRRTAAGLFTIWGLDHDGAYADDDGQYGEPGFVHALLIGEALSGDTTMTGLSPSLQRVLWKTVAPVLRWLGYSGTDEKYLQDAFWESTVEQPEL